VAEPVHALQFTAPDVIEADGPATDTQSDAHREIQPELHPELNALRLAASVSSASGSYEAIIPFRLI
jgi:hypothetical protein